MPYPKLRNGGMVPRAIPLVRWKILNVWWQVGQHPGVFLYDLLAREPHGWRCFAEAWKIVLRALYDLWWKVLAATIAWTLIEDDCNYTGSSEDLLSNEKVEEECEPPGTFGWGARSSLAQSRVLHGDRKYQRKGTLKVLSTWLFKSVLCRSKQCKDDT